LIELWETFLMQLDADEGEDPFYRPAPQPSATETSKSAEPAQESVSGPENDVEAAATATIEQEA
jgi:sorting nexin-1/2